MIVAIVCTSSYDHVPLSSYVRVSRVTIPDPLMITGHMINSCGIYSPILVPITSNPMGDSTVLYLLFCHCQVSNIKRSEYIVYRDTSWVSEEVLSTSFNGMLLSYKGGHPKFLKLVVEVNIIKYVNLFHINYHPIPRPRQCPSPLTPPTTTTTTIITCIIIRHWVFFSDLLIY